MAKGSAPQAGVGQYGTNSLQFQPPFPHQYSQYQGQFAQPPLPPLPGQEADAQAFQSFEDINFQGVAGNFDPNLQSPSAGARRSTSKSRKSSPVDEDQRPDSLSAFRQSKHSHRQNLHIMAPKKNTKTAAKGSRSSPRNAAGKENAENESASADQIAEMQAQIEKLKKQNEVLKKKKPLSLPMAVSLKKQTSDEMCNKLAQAFKNVYFRSIKFLQSDQDAVTLTNKLINLVYSDPELAEINDDFRSTFCNSYHKAVSSIVSQARGYVQQQMKNAAFDWISKYTTLPSLELIEKCALRKIDMEDAEELKVFEWYWESMLGRHGGFASSWNDDNKYYNCPSTLTYYHTRAGTLKLFTPATEALFVVIYDNCMGKWPFMYIWKQENPKTRMPATENKNKHEDMHKTKYSKCDSGQQKYAGFSTAGLQKFKATVKAIKDARKETKTVQMPMLDPETGDELEGTTEVEVNSYLHLEEKMLEHLREKRNKSAETAEEEQQQKKKRKLGKISAPGVDLDLDFDED